MALHLAVALNIVLHKHTFSIENGVRELPDPVAEDEKACGAGQHKVEFDVAMAKEEVVYVLMCLEVIFGKKHEMLFVLAHIRRLFASFSLETGVFCPVESELHSYVCR